MEEVFRFSIIRNPQAISHEKQVSSTLHMIDEEDANGQKYPFFSRLKQLRSKESLEKIMDRASVEMQEDHFLKDPNQLRTRLSEFDNWLYSQKSLREGPLRAKALELFGDLQELIVSESFKQDKYQIADSLVLASTKAPSYVSLRSQLMHLRRLVFLIEALASDDPLGSKKLHSILNATVLLPPQLFPLPNQNEKRHKKHRDDRKANEAFLKEKIRKINDLNQDIQHYSEAIEELRQVYALHLLRIKNNTEAKSHIKHKLSLLPSEDYSGLGEMTKKLISEIIGPTDHAIDVPYVVQRIEGRITAITGQISYDRHAVDAFNPADKVVIIEGICGACRMVETQDQKLANNFTAKTRGKVISVESQDLMVVRQELLDYKPGEIAHIENVLKGESKSRKHRKLDRTEESSFVEAEREEEFENDLETTDRFEMQSETAKTINKDVSKEAGVKVTYGGAVKVEAHGNYASSTATEDSRRSASTYSKDVVNRSVQKIKERVLRRRKRTTIREVEIINKHKIDNTQSTTGGVDNGSGHVTGIYRWVDKRYKAQVFNYGKRGILEFMIPEPAAFYRYAMNKKPVESTAVPKPEEPGFCTRGVFSKLRPTDLSVSNYICFVSKYGVSDATPPPPRYVVESGAASIHFKSESSSVHAGDKIEPITIPNDYKAIYAKYNLAAARGHSQSGSDDNEKANFGIRVTLGNKLILAKDLTENKDDTSRGDMLHNRFPFDSELKLDRLEEEVILDHEEGTINLGIAYSSDINFYAILNVAITCERKAEVYQQWQIDTYSSIMSAYYSQKLDYEESLKAQAFEAQINIEGQNPLINRQVEKTELKKHAISILTGQQYEGFNAMWQNTNLGLGYPEIDLEDAAEEGQFVQFFEQAFEWQHSTYVFYDYFWGRKNHWINILHLKDSDPIFEKFLKAGYARMWVPIRPGFEELVAHYVSVGGKPWTEKDAPIYADQDNNTSTATDDNARYPFVPLIEELKQQLSNEFTERPGKVEATQNSVQVRGIDDTDFSEADVDREILIDLRSYRITAVDESTQTITIGEAFAGMSSTYGVALGATYIGEAWTVEVPTNLVWLDTQDDLTKVSRS